MNNKMNCEEKIQNYNNDEKEGMNDYNNIDEKNYDHSDCEAKGEEKESLGEREEEVVEEEKTQEQAQYEYEEDKKEQPEEEYTAEEGKEKELSKLKEELKLEKAKATEYYNRLNRLQADFDNFRRRNQKEKEEIRKYGAENLVSNLLPVMDNFRRALEAPPGDSEKLLEGVKMIYRQLEEVLEEEGLKAIASEGEEFDPNVHEAAMQEVTDEYPDNTVIEEMRKGYYFKDKLLRPAMVKVARNS